MDPCDDGCLNHNMSSNTIPNGGDDPCNTNGNGVFCTGSYWYYDPTLPGADTALHGDCPRLFLRTGGTCTMNQWIEIALTQLETSTDDPVIGTDCCPAGTIWHNTTTNTYWIGLGDCNWCILCQETYVETFYAFNPLIVLPGGPIPPGEILVPEPLLLIPLTNNTSKDMEVIVRADGIQANVGNLSATPGSFSVRAELSTNGGSTWFTQANWENGVIVDQQSNLFSDAGFNTASIYYTERLSPGESRQYAYRRFYYSGVRLPPELQDSLSRLDEANLTVTAIAV